MAETKVKCPLCEGRGEVLNSEIPERLVRNGESLGGPELAGVARQDRDFKKEVHQWNPQLPIWQRSPKE